MHLPPGEGICDNFSSAHDRQALRRFVTLEFERNGNVDSVISNGALAIISDAFEGGGQWPRDIL